jgi:polysaccharide biosynthesis transport protein
MDLARASARVRTLAGLTVLSWLVVPLFVVAGAGIAVERTGRQTPQYRAEAMVLLTVQGGTQAELLSGGVASQQLVPFYSDVVTTEAVLDPAIASLGLDLTAAELADRMDVQSASNTVVLRIGVRDPSGPEAARIARAVAEQFRATMATLAPKRADGRPPAAAQLVSNTVPWRQVSPRPRADLGIGLLAGLVLGVAALMLLRRVARPVSSRELVARVTDVPVIGSVHDSPEHRPLTMRTRDARAEAYRMLRTGLRLRQPDAGTQCLVVTSSVHGEGRSTTTVDLGIAMAHTARRVLIVDADLDSRGLAGLLDLDNSTGLAQVLAGTATIGDTVRTWRGEAMLGSLDVLPAGAPVAGAAQLLSSPAMDELLLFLRTRYDRVLIDTGPLLSMADGAVLAARTDGALLLVDSRRTRQRQLAESIGRLALAGADVLGVVLTRVPAPQPETPPRRRTPAAATPTA